MDVQEGSPWDGRVTEFFFPEKIWSQVTHTEKYLGMEGGVLREATSEEKLIYSYIGKPIISLLSWVTRVVFPPPP